jgi:hypothetical protein
LYFGRINTGLIEVLYFRCLVPIPLAQGGWPTNGLFIHSPNLTHETSFKQNHGKALLNLSMLCFCFRIDRGATASCTFRQLRKIGVNAVTSYSFCWHLNFRFEWKEVM